MKHFVEIIMGIGWIVYHFGRVNEAGAREINMRWIEIVDLRKSADKHEYREVMDSYISSTLCNISERESLEVITVLEPSTLNTMGNDESSKCLRNYWYAIDNAIDKIIRREVVYVDGKKIPIALDIESIPMVFGTMRQPSAEVLFGLDYNPFDGVDHDYDEDEDDFDDGQTMDMSDGLMEVPNNGY